MSVYGISDLHLSLTDFFSTGCESKVNEHKPMSVFGNHWENHTEKLFANWNSVIKPEDTVIMPGDLSWAMSLKETVYDFDFLSKLNGKIIISKGNHDYWWDTKAKILKCLPDNVIPLQNESILLGDIILSATRGWICPGGKDFKADDEKIYKRELIRLEIALQNAEKIKEQYPEKKFENWVMVHYRPTNDDFEQSGFVDLMQKYGVSRCFYGHLHGKPCYNVLQGEHFGIEFQLLSCDYLDFVPLKLHNQ